MTERATLPGLDTLELATLKALILSQHEQLLSKDEQLASRDSEIEQLKLLIALPLYRQEEIYAREGVELDRSTLADWVGGTSKLLGPLVEALRRQVMSAEKLHDDGTPVPVLAPGNGKTKNQTAVDLRAR